MCSPGPFCEAHVVEQVAAVGGGRLGAAAVETLAAHQTAAPLVPTAGAAPRAIRALL